MARTSDLETESQRSYSAASLLCDFALVYNLALSLSFLICEVVIRHLH